MLPTRLNLEGSKHTQLKVFNANPIAREQPIWVRKPSALELKMVRKTVKKFAGERLRVNNCLVSLLKNKD
jgi:hypothetical protein